MIKQNYFVQDSKKKYLFRFLDWKAGKIGKLFCFEILLIRRIKQTTGIN